MNIRHPFLLRCFLTFSLLAASGTVVKAEEKAVALPRVLIIGDSISIGYTQFVKELLKDEAIVTRPVTEKGKRINCAGTQNGVINIDRWLQSQGGNWDVIHFNFGLHDLKRIDPTTGKSSNNPEDPNQSPPAEYEKQLRTIVEKLKKTDAKLIFATTTPVPAGGVKPHRDVAAPAQYNKIALQVMQEHEIQINDLYSLANKKLTEIQRPVNVHFTPEGSKYLAEEVAKQIRSCLK